jgi:catechol 2,3-dioxygenase-like lactoylglutathione lyase family enzyme
MGASGTGAGRRDGFGIHSIGEFVLAVPDLKVAEHYYGAFGLRVASDRLGLTLQGFETDHRWGRVVERPRKHLHHVTFLCFPEDEERFRFHLERERIAQVDAPREFDGNGVWFRDPDGLLLNVHAGAKTSPLAMATILPPHRDEGLRNAPYRRATDPARPRRLSHILRFTPDVARATEFYARILGLRLSDKSGEGIAFLHGIHGSDHHMMAFVKSDGPGLHHLSWDMPSVDAVGLGAMTMADKGYASGWGVGRHVLGSNYFYYARDPWGSYCEYSCGIDYIPAATDWQAIDHPAEESFYLWGPAVPPEFVVNHEAAQR